MKMKNLNAPTFLTFTKRINTDRKIGAIATLIKFEIGTMLPKLLFSINIVTASNTNNILRKNEKIIFFSKSQTSL